MSNGEQTASNSQELDYASIMNAKQPFMYRLGGYKERVKHWLMTILRTILLIGLSFVILYPILQKLSEAFKNEIDIYNLNVIWIPQNFTLYNVKAMVHILDYWTTMPNTALLSALVMILQTASCVLAGYAFARLRFPGSNFLFVCAIFTILVPPQTLMVPLYMHFKDFDIFGLVHLFTGNNGYNLINSFWPITLSAAVGVGVKTGLYVYIFRQFFRGVPKELEEAAYIDGAGIFRTFWRVMLPSAVPAMITVMLFSFVWQWNDTFFVNLYMGNTQVLAIYLSSLPPKIANYLIGSQELNLVDPFYMSMMKDIAVLFMMAPLIIMYLFVQRYFVESVERTGLIG